MAAMVTKLDARRGGQRPPEAGGPTVRTAIDGFLDSPDVSPQMGGEKRPQAGTLRVRRP